MSDNYPLLALMADCDGTENLSALQAVVSAAEESRKDSAVPSTPEVGRPSSHGHCSTPSSPSPSPSPSAHACGVDDAIPAPTAAVAVAQSSTRNRVALRELHLEEVKCEYVAEETNNTQDGNLIERISSSDRIRTKTYKLQRELQDLVVRHSTRHERLQSIRARQSTVGRESRVWPSHSSGDTSPGRSRQFSHRGKATGPQLPNLRKCFEESRAKYLIEAERKKRTLPPLYSSHIPRTDEDLFEKKERDIMKDPGSFGLRFFNHASLPDSPKSKRFM